MDLFTHVEWLHARHEGSRETRPSCPLRKHGSSKAQHGTGLVFSSRQEMPHAVQTAYVAPPSTKFVSSHRRSWMVLKAERSLSQVTRLRGA